MSPRPRKPIDIREAVLEALRRRNMSRADFARRMADRGILARESAYRYLTGARDTTAQTAGAMLADLGYRLEASPASREKPALAYIK